MRTRLRTTKRRSQSCKWPTKKRGSFGWQNSVRFKTKLMSYVTIIKHLSSSVSFNHPDSCYHCHLSCHYLSLASEFTFARYWGTKFSPWFASSPSSPTGLWGWPCQLQKRLSTSQTVWGSFDVSSCVFTTLLTINVLFFHPSLSLTFSTQENICNLYLQDSTVLPPIWYYRETVWDKDI